MFVFFERRDDLHSAMLKVKRFPSESEDLSQPTASGVGTLPCHGRCDGASLLDQRGPAEGVGGITFQLQAAGYLSLALTALAGLTPIKEPQSCGNAKYCMLVLQDVGRSIEAWRR
jgi:hypothetical protein